MDFIKNFLSHFLAIIMFVGMLLLTLTFLSRDTITYHNIYSALEDSKLLESELRNNDNLKELGIPEDLYEYIEIEDLLYEFFTNKFLYKAKIIKEEPVLNKEKINDRIEIGLEKYIDAKISEYAGDADAFINGTGLNSKIKEEVKKYIEDKTKIDLSNNEYISDREIKYITNYAEEVIKKLEDSTYIFDFTDVIYNDTLVVIYILAIIIPFVLIAIINLNLLPAISLTVSPVLINLIICLIIVLSAIFVNFGGSPITIILNSLLDDLSVVAFKYFVIYIVIFMFMLMLQLIVKLIYKRILSKKGITTEDNVLDDYDEIDKKEEK